MATRWSRDAHRNRLQQTAWTANSQRDWLWGVATADWTWHTEYYVRNIDWSRWITDCCRSMRNGSSYCGRRIVNGSQLICYPYGAAGRWNNQQGF